LLYWEYAVTFRKVLIIVNSPSPLSLFSFLSCPQFLE
jgi:hypothetical protein